MCNQWSVPNAIINNSSIYVYRYYYSINQLLCNQAASNQTRSEWIKNMNYLYILLLVSTHRWSIYQVYSFLYNYNYIHIFDGRFGRLLLRTPMFCNSTCCFFLIIDSLEIFSFYVFLFGESFQWSKSKYTILTRHKNCITCKWCIYKLYCIMRLKIQCVLNIASYNVKFKHLMVNCTHLWPYKCMTVGLYGICMYTYTCRCVFLPGTATYTYREALWFCNSA